MPPFLPRKRLNSTPPPEVKAAPNKKPKLSINQTARPVDSPPGSKTRVVDVSDTSDSSLSDIDSDEIDEVPPKSKPSGAVSNAVDGNREEEEDDDDEDEDIEWEDAAAATPQETLQNQPERQPLSDGPIQITLRKDDFEIDYGTAAAATAGKKGPSKREKEVRIRAHQMHVKFLLWHNSVRNRWICDRTVQQTLVRQLPAQIRKEVDKWKKASGLSLPESDIASKSAKGKKRARDKAAIDPRKERDWTRGNQKLEPTRADLSHGDPLIHLLKVLSAYWKKRFAIVAPGLRKRGYGTKQQLKQDIYSFRNDDHDPEVHGERIRDLGEFRQLAEKCEGSRDTGAILFTALLRGLGIESRLVASLQPAGFGWTKAEQMAPRKPVRVVVPDSSSSSSEDEEDAMSITEITDDHAESRPSASSRGPRSGDNARTPAGTKPRTSQNGLPDDDSDSVIDVTPSLPKRRPQKYDRDIPSPIYWAEAISPITNKVIPVDPLVLRTPVANTPEVLSLFEPRGTRAECAKLVIAYVIAYSSDGTAKDVTVRYLKKHIFPGKTKGIRFPVEKIPVYNKYGKIKRYEDYDWFKMTMSGYVRPDLMRTAVDDVEDSTDLVPQEPEKKEGREDVDTLQSLKASADFVLERFLRREEALRTGAKPVRTFTSGKGDKLKSEPVFRRADVERCLTAESWHKEGRKPKPGETPLKLVPVRAVTLTRKREAEEHQRITGEKQMQGLYSWDQTEYIIPPPIVDGKIPKNSYGNIDCFVPTMVPRGAVHLPLRGCVRVCKKLGIDFAEAVTGFEFGNKRAVPICTGVVVAKENEKLVVDAWRAWHEEQRRKEESKMEKLVLDLWRKFLMGLRIRERVQEEYGDTSQNQPTFDQGGSRDVPIAIDDDDEDTMPSGPQADDDDDMGGGFLLDDDEEQGGELEMVHHDDPKSYMAKEPEADGDSLIPTSTAQFRPEPVRRQRKLLATEENSSQESELSDALEDVSPEEESDGTDNNYEGSPIRPTPHRQHPKTSSNIEILIPPRRRTRESPVPTSSRTPSLSSELHEDDSDNESEGYKPSRSTRKVRKPTATPGGRDTSVSASRKTRSTKGVRKSKGRAAVSAGDTDMYDDDDETPGTPKYLKRKLRGDGNVVTSPYFS